MGEYSEANFVALFQGYRLKEAIIPPHLFLLATISAYPFRLL